MPPGVYLICVICGDHLRTTELVFMHRWRWDGHNRFSASRHPDECCPGAATA